MDEKQSFIRRSAIEVRIRKENRIRTGKLLLLCPTSVDTAGVWQESRVYFLAVHLERTWLSSSGEIRSLRKHSKLVHNVFGTSPTDQRLQQSCNRVQVPLEPFIGYSESLTPPSITEFKHLSMAYRSDSVGAA